MFTAVQMRFLIPLHNDVNCFRLCYFWLANIINLSPHLLSGILVIILLFLGHQLSSLFATTVSLFSTNVFCKLLFLFNDFCNISYVMISWAYRRYIEFQRNECFKLLKIKHKCNISGLQQIIWYTYQYVQWFQNE